MARAQAEAYEKLAGEGALVQRRAARARRGHKTYAAMQRVVARAALGGLCARARRGGGGGGDDAAPHTASTNDGGGAGAGRTAQEANPFCVLEFERVKDLLAGADDGMGAEFERTAAAVASRVAPLRAAFARAAGGGGGAGGVALGGFRTLLEDATLLHARKLPAARAARCVARATRARGAAVPSGSANNDAEERRAAAVAERRDPMAPAAFTEAVLRAAKRRYGDTSIARRAKGKEPRVLSECLAKFVDEKLARAVKGGAMAVKAKPARNEAAARAHTSTTFITEGAGATDQAAARTPEPLSWPTGGKEEGGKEELPDGEDVWNELFG